MAAADIIQAYQMSLGRTPEPEELAYWTNAIAQGGNPNDAVTAIATSPEAQVFAQQNIPQSSSTALYAPGQMGASYARGTLDDLFMQRLGREAEPEAEAWIAQKLAEGWNYNDVDRFIRESEEYKNQPLITRPNTQSLMPQGDTPQAFTSRTAVYPYPQGYTMNITYDQNGDRVYNYTPSDSTYTNVPSYEGSRLGSTDINWEHPLISQNQTPGLGIDNVTAGMVSNIISAATGERPSMEDVYNVYSRVGSSAKDWGDLVNQVVNAWQNPNISIGEQNPDQIYFGGLGNQISEGTAAGTPLTIGGTREYNQVFTPADEAARRAAAGIRPVTTFDIPNIFTQMPQAPAQTPQIPLYSGIPGMVAPYTLPGSIPGAPQSRYDPFLAVASMNRPAQQGVQNPFFGGTIPIDYGMLPENMIPQSYRYAEAKRQADAAAAAAAAAAAQNQAPPPGGAFLNPATGMISATGAEGFVPITNVFQAPNTPGVYTYSGPGGTGNTGNLGYIYPWAGEA